MRIGLLMPWTVALEADGYESYGLIILVAMLLALSAEQIRTGGMFVGCSGHIPYFW